MPLVFPTGSHVLLHQLALPLDVLQLSQQCLMLILYHEYILLRLVDLRLYFQSLLLNILHCLLVEQHLLLALPSEPEPHPVLLCLPPQLPLTEIPLHLEVLALESLKVMQVPDHALQVVEVLLQFLKEVVDLHELRVLLEFTLRVLEGIFHDLVLVLQLCHIFQLGLLEGENRILVPTYVFL